MTSVCHGVRSFERWRENFRILGGPFLSPLVVYQLIFNTQHRNSHVLEEIE